jgi:hypothetical protein
MLNYLRRIASYPRTAVSQIHLSISIQLGASHIQLPLMLVPQVKRSPRSYVRSWTRLEFCICFCGGSQVRVTNQ